MSVFAVAIFFAVLILFYAFRGVLYRKVFRKLFGLRFLLVGFVIIGIVFSIIYLLLDVVLYLTTGDNVFSGKFYQDRSFGERYLDYLYFSFISQLTVGYGDIVPINPVGKVLTMLQGLMGAVFMGGLVASLLNLSREALNYLYIKEIRFHYCSADANHGSEIFNMEIGLYKTEGSLFRDFTVELIARDENGKDFFIMRPDAADSTVQDKREYPLVRINSHPRFCEKDGRLAFETFRPSNKNMTPKGFVGSLEVFPIHKLILRYRYSFESRLYQKEIEIPNLDEIGGLLKISGRMDSSIVKYRQQ